MNKTIIFIFFFATIWISSCKPSKEPVAYKVWTGKDINDINNVPITAVWVKRHLGGQAWFPFKSFDSVDELREIMHYLREPEQKRSGQPFTIEENLLLYFPPPHEPVCVGFSIDEWTREFVFARGFSKKLYKLLTEKERRSNYWGLRQGEFPVNPSPFGTFDVPVNAVWVRKDAKCNWVPYKSFDSPDELIEIRRYFNEPENKEHTPCFVGDQNIVVFYLPPYEPVWLPFYLDDSTKEVVTTRGKSRELYRLFTEKEERDNFNTKTLD